MEKGHVNSIFLSMPFKKYLHLTFQPPAAWHWIHETLEQSGQHCACHRQSRHVNTGGERLLQTKGKGMASSLTPLLSSCGFPSTGLWNPIVGQEPSTFLGPKLRAILHDERKGLHWSLDHCTCLFWLAISSRGRGSKLNFAFLTQNSCLGLIPDLSTVNFLGGSWASLCFRDRWVHVAF